MFLRLFDLDGMVMYPFIICAAKHAALAGGVSVNHPCSELGCIEVIEVSGGEGHSDGVPVVGEEVMQGGGACQSQLFQREHGNDGSEI